MKEIYLRLIELIEPISFLKWTDLDKGQLESPTRPAVAFPTCLIKIEFPKTENQTRKVQRCNVLITLRIAFDFVGSRAIQTPESVRNQSLEYFDNIQTLYEALQGQTCINNQTLERIGQREEDRDDQLKVINLYFQTTYIDTTAQA